MFQNLDRLDSLARIGKLGIIGSVEFVPRNDPDYAFRNGYKLKPFQKIYQPSLKELTKINLKKCWKWILSHKSLVKFLLGIIGILFKISL